MSAPVNNRPRPLLASLAIFRIRFAEGLQYRVSALTGTMLGVFWALIEILVYSVFFLYSDRAGSLAVSGGMTLAQTISYVWLAQVLFIMQRHNIEPDILQIIESGDVSIELCRPLSLYANWFAKVASSCAVPLVWRGSSTLLVGFLFPGSWGLRLPVSIPALLCFLASALCAFLLCAAYGTLITAVRLHVTWGNGPTYMLLLLGGILSGSFLPLRLWPEVLQPFLAYQPFAGYLDIPLQFYLGLKQPAELLGAVVLQLAWTLAFILLGNLLMKHRMKTLVVQGG